MRRTRDTLTRSGFYRIECGVRSDPGRIEGVNRHLVARFLVGPSLSGRTNKAAVLHMPISLQKSLDKPRVDLPRPEIGIGENLAVQWNRGVYALDDEHLQRA
jgi:hypothetical protein